MRGVAAVREFAAVFVLAFTVTAAVSFGWSLAVHGSASVDWASAVRFGIVLGVVVPWVHARRRGS